MKKKAFPALYDDDLVGTINEIPIKAKHLTFFSYGYLTSRIGAAILPDLIPPNLKPKPNIMALSLFNLSKDTSLTMKYLPKFESNLTSTEIIKENSPIYILILFENSWILAVIKPKEKELALFNSLEMKIDFIVSIFEGILNEEFGFHPDKYKFYKTIYQENLEFNDNLFPFFLLKHFIENPSSDLDNLKLLGSNFKSYKLRTFTKFKVLEPNHSDEKTSYMNSQNIPQFFIFTPKEYSPKFDTKIIRKKNNSKNKLTIFEYKPKTAVVRANLDDTVEFIREDEVSFSFDNSLEIAKEIEPKTKTMNQPIKIVAPTISSLETKEDDPFPKKTNKILLKKKILPKPEKFLIEEKYEEKDPVVHYLHELAQDLVHEKRRLFVEETSSLALTKKELRNMIMKHGAGVRESMDQEQRERRQADEINKQENMKSYQNAMQINKTLWYYYIYFPEQYPLILSQYQQRLNEKIGIFSFPIPPPIFPDKLGNPVANIDSVDKLPQINGKYKVDFNQNHDRNQNDGEPFENRGRIYSKGLRKDRDSSLPIINNRSGSTKNHTERNKDSLDNLERGRGSSISKPAKVSISNNNAMMKKEDSNKSLLNMNKRKFSKSQNKIAERYNIIITREDMRALVKGEINLNIFDFVMNYYREKSKILEVDKNVKFFLSKEFQKNLLNYPKETLSQFERSSIIIFFPVVISVSKLIYGLLLLYPLYKKAVYYEPENSDSSGFLKNLTYELKYKGEIENMSSNMQKSGLFVFRMGYLLLNKRKDLEIDEDQLEGFKGRIQQLIYEIGVTNNEKDKMGDFNFII